MSQQLGLMLDWRGEVKQTTQEARDYLALGLPRNPFIIEREDVVRRPLYTGHIQREMGTLQDWFNLAYTSHPKPLSLVGGVGMGKTYLLSFWEGLLSQQASQRRLIVLRVSLYDYGAQHISLGGLLWAKLRDARLEGWAQVPSGAETVLVPLVWQLVAQEGVEETTARSLMERHIRQIRALPSEAQRLERAKLLCRWLNRADLTPKEYRELGEARKIDWEGELVTYLCDLFGVAERFGVCQRVYFMLDQLEDLFRSNVTTMRRSRLLTDLRHLVDEVIDHHAPLALVLAWSTEVEEVKGRVIDVKKRFSEAYPALMDRMQSGTTVELRKLGVEDREQFARTYIDALAKHEGYDLEKILTQTSKRIVERAAELAVSGGFGRAEALSPRRWQEQLARATEELAEEAAKARR